MRLDRHKPAADLLQTKDLCVEFAGLRGVRALDGVSLSVKVGEILGLVGESGSGKTVFSLSLLGLLPTAAVRRGSIFWGGNDLTGMGDEEMRRIRGSEIAMIFQNPQASLNPVRSVGSQISAVIRLHTKCDHATAKQEALRWFEAVRITEPERVYAAYPHECSGGMCQRILIAMALACRSKLLVADEPTASLDVTIQAQIMDLLLDIRERYGTAILLVSHDLGVVARMCDRIAVMYRGRIVEQAEAKDLYASPQHPYTRLLLQSVPVPDPLMRPERKPNMSDSAGPLLAAANGCPYRPRCPEAISRCGELDPGLVEVNSNGHSVACLLRFEDVNGEKPRNRDGEAPGPVLPSLRLDAQGYSAPDRGG
jgi:peptide/nickel transport system ATP-binding protein